MADRSWLGADGSSHDPPGIVLERPGPFLARRRLGIAPHHHRIARGGEEVVGLLDDAPVLPVIEAELLEPFLAAAEHLPAPALHALQHLHHPGLDPDRAVLELRVARQEAEAAPAIEL